MLFILYQILALVLLLPSLLYRWILSHFVRIFINRNCKIVTTLGAIYTRSFACPTISVIITLEGKLELEELKTNIQESIFAVKDKNGKEKFPELKQTIKNYGAYPFWCPLPDFNINQVVQEVSCKKTTKYYTEKEWILGSEPMWNVSLMYCPEEDETRLILCFHHALADGLAIAKLLAPLTEKTVQTEEGKSAATLGFKATIGALREAAGLGPRFESLNRLPPCLSGVKQGKSANVHASLRMDAIRNLAQFLGVRVSVVNMAGYTAGLRALLSVKSVNIENNVPLCFPIPWPGHPDKLRNWHSLSYIELPLLETSRSKRITVIDKNYEEAKSSIGIGLLNFTATRVFGTMPPCIQEGMNRITTDPLTFFFVPFVLSKENTCVLERTLTAARTQFQIKGFRTVAVTMLSYGDSATLCVNADAGILNEADARIFLNGWLEEMDLLSTAQDEAENLETIV